MSLSCHKEKKTKSPSVLGDDPFKVQEAQLHCSLTLVGETPCKAEEVVFSGMEVIGPRGIPTMQVTLLVEDIQQ